MKIKGGILLLFSLVVTIVALGILFLLSSTSIANLRAVSVDNSGSQLIQNIQSGKIFIENDALPEFDENDQVFIQTIESGDIIIKREQEFSSRFGGQFTFASLGDDNHLKQIGDNFTISFWMKTQNVESPSTGLKLPKLGEPLLGFSQHSLGDYEGAGFQFSFGRNAANTVANLKFGVTLVNEEETTFHSVKFDNIVDNLWTFVTVTYNGTLLKIYENEDLRQQLNVTGSIDWSTIGASAFYVGKYLDTPLNGLFFSGQIRNVGIWNADMNSASVSYIHNQGMGFNPLVEIESYDISDNLLGFWKFNDGTGTTVVDYSIFSKHGSIINRNNTDHSWTKINDKYSYKISSNYNNLKRTEHIR